MNISIYDAMQSAGKLTCEQYFEKLNDLVPEMFMPILDAYGVGCSKNIVQYIIAGYSIESKEVLLKANWSSQKPILAKKYNIPDHAYGDIVDLKSTTASQVIEKYLDFQGDFDFKHLRMLETIYEKLMSSMFTAEFKAEEIMKQKDSMSILRKEIAEYKRDLIEVYAASYQNMEQVTQGKRKRFESLANIATSENIRS
jgi:predicted CopG family antitoxin